MRHIAIFFYFLATVMGCKPAKIKTENNAELQSVNSENALEIIKLTKGKIEGGSKNWIYGLLNELPTVADRELAAVIRLSNSEESKFQEAQQIINKAFNQENGLAYELLNGFSWVTKRYLNFSLLTNKEKIINFSKNILDVLIDAKLQEMLRQASSDSAIASINSQLNADLIRIFKSSNIASEYYLDADKLDLKKFQGSDFWKVENLEEREKSEMVGQLRILIFGLIDHIVNQTNLTLNKIGEFFLAQDQQEMKVKLTNFCRSGEILNALRNLKAHFGSSNTNLKIPHFISKSERSHYYLYSHYSEEERKYNQQINPILDEGKTFTLILIPSRFVTDFPLTTSACNALTSASLPETSPQPNTNIPSTYSPSRPDQPTPH